MPLSLFAFCSDCFPRLRPSLLTLAESHPCPSVRPSVRRVCHECMCVTLGSSNGNPNEMPRIDHHTPRDGARASFPVQSLGQRQHRYRIFLLSSRVSAFPSRSLHAPRSEPIP